MTLKKPSYLCSDQIEPIPQELIIVLKKITMKLKWNCSISTKLNTMNLLKTPNKRIEQLGSYEK